MGVRPTSIDPNTELKLDDDRRIDSTVCPTFVETTIKDTTFNFLASPFFLFISDRFPLSPRIDFEARWERNQRGYKSRIFFHPLSLDRSTRLDLARSTDPDSCLVKRSPMRDLSDKLSRIKSYENKPRPIQFNESNSTIINVTLYVTLHYMLYVTLYVYMPIFFFFFFSYFIYFLH